MSVDATKGDRAEEAAEAAPSASGGMRALREGEVMGAYMDFDRTADKNWTTAEYLVRFGQYVSVRTVMANPPCLQCGAMTEAEAETKCLGAAVDECHGNQLWPGK